MKFDKSILLGILIIIIFGLLVKNFNIRNRYSLEQFNITTTTTATPTKKKNENYL
jgi:hypothetical protein